MTTPTTSNVRRATVEQINAIVNRDDVKPFLGGTLDKVVDIRTIAGWRGALALTCGDGCMVFTQERPQIWQTHLLFIPRHRNNLRDARAIMTHVYEVYDAAGIFGLVNQNNPRACKFVEALPVVKVGEESPYNVYATKRADWPWLTKREQSLN